MVTCQLNVLYVCFIQRLVCLYVYEQTPVKMANYNTCPEQVEDESVHLLICQ